MFNKNKTEKDNENLEYYKEVTQSWKKYIGHLIKSIAIYGCVSVIALIAVGFILSIFYSP